MKKTGIIWQRTRRSLSQTVRRVCESLENHYGKPRLNNPEEPIDDLVYIIISNKTTPEMASRMYLSVKKAFLNWNELTLSPSKLKEILAPAGLSTVKSEQIVAALKKIKDDFGNYSLGELMNDRDENIEGYLISLPGVSEKVAKCVMMYTMDRDVLPVDGHVHRIANRLGWVRRKRSDQCHAELEALIPPKRRYAFHVDCILHGRVICRPKSPKCNTCLIKHHCNYIKILTK